MRPDTVTTEDSESEVPVVTDPPSPPRPPRPPDPPVADAPLPAVEVAFMLLCTKAPASALPPWAPEPPDVPFEELPPVAARTVPVLVTGDLLEVVTSMVLSPPT